MKNPYIAVWIEDAKDNLVRTVDLSFENGRGIRWLNELRRWYRADSARITSGGRDLIDTISSPTRTAGSYRFSWDGKNTDKALVPHGDYFVCIEAARERGPYQLIREPITVGSGTFSKTLPDYGELQKATVELGPK